jgi:serine/threonine-protein kinase Chk2
VRERTLLSSINDVKIERVIETQPDQPPVKVFDKNAGPRFQTQRPAGQGKTKDKGKNGHFEQTAEQGPAAARDPKEFMEMGGKGDEVLFEQNESIYPGESLKADMP